jgi:hypothetical protein
MKIEVGNKIKTKLEQPVFMCSGRSIISYFHWWEVIKEENGIYTLQDNKKQQMQIDKNGIGLADKEDHKVYKIKK